MVTDGLPIGRRERGIDNDILAGADFLSVFIETSLRRAYSETTTPSPTTPLALDEENAQTIPYTYIRTPRGTSPFAQPTENQFELYQTTLNSDNKKDNGDSSEIVAIHVSSSVDRTIDNSQSVRKNAISDSITESPTTELLDQIFLAAQEHPSIVAKSSKSELSVEESEPITRNSDLDSLEIGYPAKVEEIPSPVRRSFNPSTFLNSDLPKGSKQPLHQTFIYHDSPGDPSRARSVSYSTVIQHPNIQSDIMPNPQQHERRERNYNGAQNSPINSFEANNEKNKTSATFQGDVTDLKSSSSVPLISTPKSWPSSEENYEVSAKSSATTERNWEIQQKPYSHSPPIPKVYGRSEQNYEVDEAVSVDTNGRVHGLQPSLAPTSAKNSSKDDNQKFGYVVEGRNFRKYRVEERTADGFIVGEYGVVSHDDGSLRGVRYTADGTINPRLIYDALMKFLSL
ncbi:hypothetical protein NQ317_015599 [Molorchus minor]|uniref:Uncharacterized protein n=1 Tax=Molorchus minor TaxID=1323400 RepID=A0ABQ9JZN0_9CUCU|nr:hypothetical protein NQ317_015599 [Molorchus minor]